VNLEEAKTIVRQVWNSLRKDHIARHGYTIPFLWAKIKDGYKKDKRFYRALRLILISEDWTKHHIRVAGAPPHICHRDGIRLRASKGESPRLWVYFRVEKEASERWRILSQ